MREMHKQKKHDKEILYLGIDYGETNIGLAFGRNGLVEPLMVINGKNPDTAIHEISRFIKQNHIEKVVMGLPLTAENKETKQALEVRKFAKLLKIIIKKPIEFYSEHMSTTQAIKESISMGYSQKSRQATDHISAAIILKNYFNEKPD